MSTRTKLEHLRLKKANPTNEEGLTIIELIIVIVVIGILSAIVIPIFMNQQKEAIEATLKSDIRNAVVVITTEATKTQGRMPAWLPNYATKSPDNTITVDTSRSNQYVFCLIGSNPNVDNTFYYSSATGEMSLTACPSVANGGVGGNPAPGAGGGVTPPAGGGGFTPGTSFDEQQEALQPTRKAIYVPNYRHDETSSDSNVFLAQLRSYSFDTVDRIPIAEFLAMSDTELAEYDLIATYDRAWSTDGRVVAKLTTYYENGGKVIQDGNDNQAGSNPFADEYRNGANEGLLSFNPTNNTGLTPSFPYTFEAKNFYGSDSSWRCIHTLKNGGVSIAEFVSPTDGKTCITAYGGSNSNGGRWITHHRFITLTDGVGASSMDWLLAS